MSLNYLEIEIGRLINLKRTIKNSGVIAPPNIWIERHNNGRGRGIYARKRSTKKIFPKRYRSRKKQKVAGLGEWGGIVHIDFLMQQKRRSALEEIDRRIEVLQAMVDNPIEEPTPENTVVPPLPDTANSASAASA